MEKIEREVSVWLKKIEDVKRDVDLSRDEDLSIALMNLVSLEEHFYFSAMKTNDQKYIEMLKSVRELRKKLLGMIVVDPKGEEWCISKHLLAASMRLIEVGTKELAKGEGKVKDANMLFKFAFDLYSLFFAINMKMIDQKKDLIVDAIDKVESGEKVDKKGGFMGKFSEIIKKIVDCCKEW